MTFNRILCLTAIVCVALGSFCAVAEDTGVKALLLTKSVGFQHQPVAEKDGAPSLAETVLRGILEPMGVELVATKAAESINADDLKVVNLVIFYTQGDLKQEGLDGGAPMAADGIAELTEWIKAGGGLVGFHSATDTIRTMKGSDPATPYTNLIGAAFRSHGRQFRGTVRVVEPMHPTMASIPDGFELLDEWYVFQQMNTDDMHVVALLDPGPEREKQRQYDVEPYPIAWCRALGDGRIFYNAMGHRMDVWENETFQKSVADALSWAMGKGAADAEPNYGRVVDTD